MTKLVAHHLIFSIFEHEVEVVVDQVDVVTLALLLWTTTTTRQEAIVTL